MRLVSGCACTCGAACAFKVACICKDCQFLACVGDCDDCDAPVFCGASLAGNSVSGVSTAPSWNLASPVAVGDDEGNVPKWRAAGSGRMYWIDGLLWPAGRNAT